MTQSGENWFVEAPGDIQRIEACLSGVAYAPHRHDTYTIGITLSGIQSFTYRGAGRASYPGQIVILRPDEKHDGRAGDDEAFRYRAAYISPADIQEALNGQALPFVEGGVSINAGLHRAAVALLEDFQRPLSRLQYQDALYDLALALQAAAGCAVVIKRANREAAADARDYIEASLSRGFSLEDLERATGHCRWQVSRHVRHQSVQIPHPAAAGPGAANDARRRRDCRNRPRLRLFGPEPFRTGVQAGLWANAEGLA